VLVEAGGGGRLSANQIKRSGGVGVGLREGATTQLRNNTIAECGGGGVHVAGPVQSPPICPAPCRAALSLSPTISYPSILKGGAILAENEIVVNLLVGVRLSGGADPLLEKNRVSESGSQGVLVEGASTLGRQLRNVIDANGAEGMLVQPGSAPVLGEIYVRRDAGDPERHAAEEHGPTGRTQSRANES
jgi:hypothetical protein